MYSKYKIIVWINLDYIWMAPRLKRIGNKLLIPESQILFYTLLPTSQVWIIFIILDPSYFQRLY